MSKKCHGCGVVNFTTARLAADVARSCRRSTWSPVPGPRSPVFRRARLRSGGTRLRPLGAWILGVTATILISCYVSLIASSDGISAEERQAVARAIDELERAGFSRESFALRHVVSYRSTDNWWSNYVGHQTAYAATEFPFAVVTLYPTFFKYPVDDIERATILLHESYHLLGGDEQEAPAGRLDRQEQAGVDVRPVQPHARVEEHTRVDRRQCAGAVPLRPGRAVGLSRVTRILDL